MINPIAIPATISLIGTPASNKERVDAQTDACEVEPFELSTSDTSLMAYGKSSCDGITGTNALSARAPCPISLLPGPLEGLVSPTD